MGLYSLDESVLAIINARLANEYNAERFYKNASKWCDLNGWKRASDYFVCMMHKVHHLAHKLERYATNANSEVISPAVDIPSVEATTYIDLINQSYSMEYAEFEAYKGDIISIDNTHPAFALFLEKYIKCHQEWMYNFSEMIKRLDSVSGAFELRQMEKKIFK